MLERGEVADDMRDLEKNSSMAVVIHVVLSCFPMEFLNSYVYYQDEAAGDFDPVVSILDRSLKPPCAPESSYSKKKNRYAAWIESPELVAADMSRYQAALSVVRREHDRLLEMESDWLYAAQITRSELLQSLNMFHTECKSLHAIRNALGDKIVDLCNFDMSSGFSAAIKKRAVGSVSRDIIAETEFFFVEYSKRLEKYSRLARESMETAAAADAALPVSSNKRAKRQSSDKNLGAQLPIPVVQLSLEEEKAGRVAASRYRYATRVGEPVTVKSESMDFDASRSGGKSLRSQATAREDLKDAELSPTSTLELAIACMTAAEERLRYLETTPVADMIAELFQDDKSAAANPKTLSLAECAHMTENECLSRVRSLINVSTSMGGGGGGGGTRGAKMLPKKKRVSAANAVSMSCELLLGCPRGKPLILSAAGRYPDRAVGVAPGPGAGNAGSQAIGVHLIDSVATTVERAASGASHWPAPDSLSVEDALRNQEHLEVAVCTLRGKVLAAENRISKLQSEVNGWQALSQQMQETMNSVKECHTDTNKYNEMETGAILAEMVGIPFAELPFRDEMIEYHRVSNAKSQRVGGLGVGGSGTLDPLGLLAGAANAGGAKGVVKKKVPVPKKGGPGATRGLGDDSMDILTSMALSLPEAEEDAPKPAPAPPTRRSLSLRNNGDDSGKLSQPDAGAAAGAEGVAGGAGVGGRGGARAGAQQQQSSSQDDAVASSAASKPSRPKRR
jgi:hypothetical protein